MLKTPEIYPANTASFNELLKFAKTILGLCRKLKLKPIVYGSLAYFFHTKDSTLPVNDLDLLISEAAFPNLIKLLDKQKKNLDYKVMPYHSLEVYKEDLKIDLDSIEHFLYPRPSKAIKARIGGLDFNIINLEALIDIYCEALENMPRIKKLDKKRVLYTRKLDNLRKL